MERLCSQKVNCDVSRVYNRTSLNDNFFVGHTDILDVVHTTSHATSHPLIPLIA